MLPLILLAVLGQSVDYNSTYTNDYSYPQNHSGGVSHCQAGYIFEGNSCKPCAAGKFSIAGSDTCEPCWAGSYSVEGESICHDCPKGTTSMQGSPSLALCSTQTPTTKVAQINDDELELVAKAPIANALELHNEARNAHDRAEEAQRNAEIEEAEAKQAYEQKMKAVEELHFAEKKYAEVHDEKMVAEAAKFNAVVRYEDEVKEAENAEKAAKAAKQESERAELRAYEASHAVKMQSEGEASEAVINAKIEREQHFQAEQEYQEKVFAANKEALEAKEAREEAANAAIFAEQQNQEAQLARTEEQIASSHLDIQKDEAMVAQREADMALREHKVAEAHHENVIASKQRNEKVWEDMTEHDCVDDPKGLVVNDPHKNCEGVGSETHWSCEHFDADFNGHPTFIWELCPKTCHMCGVDRDQYYEEHHHQQDEQDDLPECLADCQFEGLDIEDPDTACPWWHAEGPEHNTESCFNDCSPGVMFYVEHHVQKVCHGGPDNNPLECAMDCPIDNLNPHSAASFCPWFMARKDDNGCFMDCTDKFLNMAQAHAEHTCYDYEMEGDKYINYISEPILGADGMYSESSIICNEGYYRSSMTEPKCTVCPAAMFSSYKGAYECDACPPDLTSFPGSSSPEHCVVRASLNNGEHSYESEDKNQSEDKYQSEKREWETAATVEPVNYHTEYPSADYMPRSSVDPNTLTYNYEHMPQSAVDPSYNGEAYDTEHEYYSTESSYPTAYPVENYEYATEPVYNSYEHSYDHYTPASDYYHTPTPSFEAEPVYNSNEPSYDSYTAASDYYHTTTPSVEHFATGQASEYYTPTPEYHTTTPEFVDAEYAAGQPQFGELTAPQDTYSPSTNMESEAELISGSGNH